MATTETPKHPSRLTLYLAILALTLAAILGLLIALVPPFGGSPTVHRPSVHFPPSKWKFATGHLGDTAREPAHITNVQIVDLDKDGRNDVLVCDGKWGRILWYRKTKSGAWQEQILNAETLPGPAHATVLDLDNDKDSDVIVSVMGSVWPTDERIGRVVWLKNTGGEKFTVEPALLDDVRRVTDVQGGDFDKDGDIDLVVAVFGFQHGQIVYLENNGAQRFREKELLYAPGTIHVPVGDFDNDGDADFVAVVSQDEEEVWGFENTGTKTFQPRRRKLWFSYNFDFGSSGLVACDLDQDKDLDLLLTAGDNLELLHNHPQKWHGCVWLENKGEWTFKAHRLATFGGTYAAASGDIDGDGDMDVVLVSLFNDWGRKNAASIIWLENDGRQNFQPWQIADTPIRLATVACGDLNGDGRADIVGGCFHLLEPFDRLGRVPMWLSGKGPGR